MATETPNESNGITANTPIGNVSVTGRTTTLVVGFGIIIMSNYLIHDTMVHEINRLSIAVSYSTCLTWHSLLYDDKEKLRRALREDSWEQLCPFIAQMHERKTIIERLFKQR